MSNPLSNNPNAVVSGGSGIGGGLLVVQVFKWLGVDLDAGQGVLIAGALGFAALFVGRNGIRGALRVIWKGRG